MKWVLALLTITALLFWALNALARRDIHQCAYAANRTGKSNRCAAPGETLARWPG